MLSFQLKKTFIDTIINKDVALSKLSRDLDLKSIGALESQMSNLSSHKPDESQIVSPVAEYVKVLSNIRQLSASSSGLYDEMQVAVRLQNDLQALVKKFNLAEEHFQIDTSGEPIIVQEGSGGHVILPTHFEKGAYLSQPHADHHLALKADQLPKIRFGRYIRLGRNVGVNAGGNINIGDAVWLSPGSYLLKQNHDPYGRPSIGARTVLMTQLPSIKICDFAWIGKEAVIGWDADYIGKASIVATRSFLNSWVGDYTITGSQGKVIQYFPYKAAAFELLDLDLESMLRVSDWEKVNELWLKEYKLFLSKYRCKEPLPSVRGLLTDANRRGARMLDMSPKLGDNIMFAAKLGLQVDAVARDRKAFPFILQRLQDQN